MRAKYQVLVLPYKRTDKILYCIFKRSDTDCWQFIVGGGETEDDTVLISAKRESYEEAGISPNGKYSELETLCSISIENFLARKFWGENCLVIPEYSFAVEITNSDITISREHTMFEWVDFSAALKRLKYDSNKVALWELDNKLRMGLI